MSYLASAFILQKSNEVLSMIFAFKRKTNNNTCSSTTTANDASNSSPVNCTNLSLNDQNVPSCGSSDDCKSNIYTEVNLCDNLPTKNLITESNPASSSGFLSCDILRFLFNDSLNSTELHFTGDHNQSETNEINGYANESVTSQAFAEIEMYVINGEIQTEQNPYEINSAAANNVTSKLTSRQKSEKTDEITGGATISDSSLRSNAFFANISKSRKHKLKRMVTDDGVSNTSSEIMACTANQKKLAKDDIVKASLKRLKFKLGLHFSQDTKVR